MNTVAYPKILHLGDKPIADLFDGEVEITEKVDGSQFGFGKINGQLVCRSKGMEQDLDNPDKLFSAAIEYVKLIVHSLPDNVFFYGEVLSKPRHSTLAYDRTPKNHIALFGVIRPDRSMGDYTEILQWSYILGVDAVPLIYQGTTTAEEAIKLIERESYLGGQKIEGIVVKRYEPWIFLGQILTPVKAGKLVSEQFKEVHHRDWAKLNTAKGAFELLQNSICTEARWIKAVHHLRDAGQFTGTVKDIGLLIKEIQRDVADEEKESLKDQLWRIYGSDLLKGSTRGFVDWYKEQIALGRYHDDQDS